MDNKGKFKPGTRFLGNVSGVPFEVVKVENHNVTIKNLHSGDIFTYGLRALEKCDVTILEVR